MKGCRQATSPATFLTLFHLPWLFCFHISELICPDHLSVPSNLSGRLHHSASISLVPGTSPPFLHPHRAANARRPGLTGCTHCECVFEHGVHLCVCWHVLVCVCGPFSTPLGPLICFGSVWWAGHEANYLLKGKSEPNEPQRATELTGLIKHSVCFNGRLPLEAAVSAHTHTATAYNVKYRTRKHKEPFSVDAGQSATCVVLPFCLMRIKHKNKKTDTTLAGQNTKS